MTTSADIDATKPEQGKPKTADQRANWSVAKTALAAVERGTNTGSINAIAYGCKGDGSDETATILGLIAYGKPIKFPGGYTYGFSAQLPFVQDVWGDGPSTVLSALYTGATNYQTSPILSASNIQLRDFQLTQPTAVMRDVASTTGSGGNLLTVVTSQPLAGVLANGDTCSLWGITSPADHNFAGKVITITGANTFTVSGAFTNGLGALRTQGSYTGKTRNNGKPAIIVGSGVNEWALENIKINGSNGGGIWIFPDTHQFRIEGMDISMCRADSISCQSNSATNQPASTNGMILNNRIDRCGDDSISLVGATSCSTPIRWMQIRGNRIRRNLAACLRNMGADDVIWSDNQVEDCFGGLQLGYSASGPQTYGSNRIAIDRLQMDTVGAEGASVGAVKLVGNATFPCSDIKILHSSFMNVRYRGIFSTGGVLGDNSDLTIENVNMYNVGILNDADAATSGQLAVNLDYIKNLRINGLAIRETGGSALVLGDHLSGEVDFDRIILSAVNRNGGAGIHGWSMGATTNIDVIRMGNVRHESQVGAGGTYTIVRQGVFFDDPGTKLLRSGQQLSYASSGITTKFPINTSAHTLPTNQHGNEVCLFATLANVNMQTVGDNTLAQMAPMFTAGYILTAIVLVRQTGAFNTDCQLDMRTAAAGGGTLLAQTTGGASEFSTLTGANTISYLPLLSAGKNAFLTATPLYARITTGNGAALTTAIYVLGRPIGQN